MADDPTPIRVLNINACDALSILPGSISPLAGHERHVVSEMKFDGGYSSDGQWVTIKCSCGESVAGQIR